MIFPFQNFPTADGWIVVACPKEKFWRQLCDAIERPELAEEFPSFADRDRRRDELEPILEEVFRARTSDDWLGALAAAGVPSAPVNEVESALEEARIVEYEHTALGTVRQVASPLRLSGEEPPLRPRRSAAPTRSRCWSSCAATSLNGCESSRLREFSEHRKELQMGRNAIQPEGLATPKPPYSPVVVAGDTVYTAGQIANGPDGNLVEGGIVEQTRQALENVRTCVEAGGLTMGDVVKVNAYLADLGDFPGYNEVYIGFFDAPYPARTSVQAGLPAGVLVEIEAVARRAS